MINRIVFAFCLVSVLVFDSVECLGSYCSQVDRKQILKKFDDCSQYLDISGNEDLKENYINILNMLNNVLDAIENNNSTKNETKHLFFGMLNMVEFANNQTEFKDCFVSLCNLFKNCEFPIKISYLNFDSIAMAAARMAAMLTAFTFNEKFENKVLLTETNLNTQLKLTVLDNENIYDGKIIFKANQHQEMHAFHATKDLDTKEVVVGDLKQVLENTKNFRWYYVWDSKTINMNLDRVYSNETNQFFYPISSEFNKNRYVSAVTYDCFKTVWNRIVSVPFIYPNGEIRGIVAISISLKNFDLKQCGDESSMDNNLDPFYNTDKCDRKTTKCINIEGKGFVLGSYYCKCKPGYYTNTNLTNKKSCFKCADGCDTCDDERPCKIEIPEDLKRTALLTNLGCILICVILALLIWYNMALKVLKTSSPNMLFMVLIGSIMAYCEIIPMYFSPNYWTCTSAQVLQLEGFLLTYGALVLKTWRWECKLFYVRSVKTIKITDVSLMKRLGIIMLVGTVYLMCWSVRKYDSPREIEQLDPDNLKYQTCTITEWNYISLLIQLAVLSWGVVLAIQVRRASIAFKETKLITWAIFNECFVKLFVIMLNAFLFNKLKVFAYMPFLFNFIRVHLTITVMLLLLFSYKIYSIIIARQKPFQSNQSSLLNNFSVACNDGEQKNSSINDETEKERELKVEIQRLCRQLEEMRSLSMRIANPHLLAKKSRFINYPTKKIKTTKNKFILPLPIADTNKMESTGESQPLEINRSEKLKPIEE